MPNFLGEIIFNTRKADSLTQDEYGRRYGVSGPAIFKFEKGYVKPSLQLWLKMAADAALPERTAVLLRAKAKLPQKYADYIEMQGAAKSERDLSSKKKRRAMYSGLLKREELIAQGKRDSSLPEGIRDFLADDELWALYKPTGKELDRLIDIFSPLGKGSTGQYREALCLLRSFSGKSS